MLIEFERGLTLERFQEPAGADWVNKATGETYDAVGNFDGKHFQYQWPNLQQAIVDHLSKADYVPVDVSKFSVEQRAMVTEFVERLGTSRVFIVGDR